MSELSSIKTAFQTRMISGGTIAAIQAFLWQWLLLAIAAALIPISIFAYQTLFTPNFARFEPGAILAFGLFAGLVLLLAWGMDAIQSRYLPGFSRRLIPGQTPVAVTS